MLFVLGSTTLGVSIEPRAAQDGGTAWIVRQAKPVTAAIAVKTNSNNANFLTRVTVMSFNAYGEKDRQAIGSQQNH